MYDFIFWVIDVVVMVFIFDVKFFNGGFINVVILFVLDMLE